MPRFVSRGGSSDPLELLIQYRTGLRVLLERARWAEPVGAPMDQRVEELLSDEARLGWDTLYEAEQRLIAALPEEEVMAEAGQRFVEAEQMRLPDLPAVRDAWQAIRADDLARRRSQLRALVGAVQAHHVHRRLEREMRTRASRALVALGTLIVVLSAGTLVFLSFRPTEIGGRFQILTVMAFGLLGAWFSRMIAFHISGDSLDPQAVASDFRLRFVWMRLLVGAASALVFYYMIVAGLVAGELFPKLAATLKVFEVPYAKLVVWSFLAGFCERLVPRSLERPDRR